jgi:hypothetical protein
MQTAWWGSIGPAERNSHFLALLQWLDRRRGIQLLWAALPARPADGDTLIWINDANRNPPYPASSTWNRLPVHMGSPHLERQPPRPKHCPMCGVAMLATRSHGSREADRFECLNCDLVINYSRSRRPGPPTLEE